MAGMIFAYPYVINKKGKNPVNNIKVTTLACALLLSIGISPAVVAATATIDSGNGTVTDGSGNPSTVIINFQLDITGPGPVSVLITDTSGADLGMANSFDNFIINNTGTPWTNILTTVSAAPGQPLNAGDVWFGIVALDRFGAQATAEIASPTSLNFVFGTPIADGFAAHGVGVLASGPQTFLAPIFGGPPGLGYVNEGGQTQFLLTFEPNAAVVPVPAAVWLFASALGGLMFRRKRS
jgi:hypothetical protein